MIGKKYIIGGIKKKRKGDMLLQSRPLNLLLISSYSPTVIIGYSREMEILGRIIFERGHNLLISPGKNLPTVAAEAFMKIRDTYVEGKTPKCIGYYVNKIFIPKIEQVDFIPDEPVEVPPKYSEKAQRRAIERAKNISIKKLMDLYEERDEAAIKRADGVIIFAGHEKVGKRMHDALKAGRPVSVLGNTNEYIDNLLTRIEKLPERLNVCYNNLYGLVDFIEDWHGVKGLNRDMVFSRYEHI